MKARLSLLYFLQFGVWGCYLTCFGQFLGSGGLGGKIAWFYAAIGLVSIITPPLLGRLADRTGRPERLLGLCHLTAAVIMFVMWRYGMTHSHLEFIIFYPLYLLFLALYMPTMALANTSTFGLLTQSGNTPVSSFPSIRIWGTVGFVASMWFVNCAYWKDGALGFSFSESGAVGHLRFQYNAMQLLCSGIMGVLAALYSFSLPSLKSSQTADENLTSKVVKIPLRQAIRIMFVKCNIAVFLIFVILSGVCLQISNGFVTPFLTHFSGISQYMASLASGNATMLFSLSQISEAVCILLVGISLKSKGIRYVYAIGLLAWSLRFLMLGVGNPGNGLWLLVGSMLIYGIAFNFITIAGHIYIQDVAPSNMKGFAQGIMMFMITGIGAPFGTIAAGAIVNRWWQWEMVNSSCSGAPMRLFMGDWIYPWSIFAACAFVVMILWLIISKKIF
ncbi:MAG: MFS transporter [Muribaculaceae bacterium]|nr:MFS transporter [Muribaculaceae bacterium]